MKLEVGMYVRTYSGKLFKIINVKQIKIFHKLCIEGYDGQSSVYFGIKNIKKAKHKLTELIEINDIVQIRENIDNYSKSYFIGIDEMSTLKAMTERMKNNNLILESILTKEQFDNYCYRNGDKNE